MMDANTYYAAMLFRQAPNGRDGKGEHYGGYNGGQDEVNSRTAALQEVSSSTTTNLAPSQQSRPTATPASSPLTRASAFASSTTATENRSMTSLGPPQPRPFSGSSNPSSLAPSHPVYQTITTTATATTATATAATATNDGLLSANAPFPVTTTTIAQRNQTQSSSHLHAHHALAFAQIASSANFQTQPAQLRANASMTSPTTASSTHLDFRKPTTGDRTITTNTTTIAPSSASPSHSHSRPPLSSPLSHPFNHAAPHHHSSILLSPPPLAPPQGALSSIMAS
ncbi:hypothetical protein F4680DRAFT_400443, partial [Xylaria scruposa]